MRLQGLVKMLESGIDPDTPSAGLSRHMGLLLCIEGYTVVYGLGDLGLRVKGSDLGFRI